MKFDLFIPYQNTMGDSKSMDDYYRSEEDYINALRTEESSNGALIFNTMANGGIYGSTYYGAFNNNVRNYDEIPEIITYSKASCVLMSANGGSPETVDTMIDKFASQNEFLVTVNFDMQSMDAEFEEELREWNSETISILKTGQKMGNEWVETNIPRRNLRLSFLNKSQKLVQFTLDSCEIERKLSKNSYLIYVKRMLILK